MHTVQLRRASQCAAMPMREAIQSLTEYLELHLSSCVSWLRVVLFVAFVAPPSDFVGEGGDPEAIAG